MKAARASLWLSVGMVASVFGYAALASAEAPAAAPDGKTVFLDQKCPKCHTAPGIQGGKTDLTGVGKKHTTDWMKKWLLKEEELDGKKHKKKFSGTDAELDVLVKWLATFK